MQELYVDLRQCTNYLVQFFYKTNQRYSCTRTKIGKLLSILAFKYACDGSQLFKEAIYRYPNCGTLIKETVYFVPCDVYNRKMEEENADGKKTIFDVELNYDAFIPEYYRNVSWCYSWCRTDIENLFYTFGAYSQKDLSDVLNPIVEYKGICRPDGSIDLEAIASLDKNQFPDNKVVEYILKN